MTGYKLDNLGQALHSLDKALASPITEERDLGGIIKAFERATSWHGRPLKPIWIAKVTPRKGHETSFALLGG